MMLLTEDKGEIEKEYMIYFGGQIKSMAEPVLKPPMRLSCKQ